MRQGLDTRPGRGIEEGLHRRIWRVGGRCLDLNEFLSVGESLVKELRGLLLPDCPLGRVRRALGRARRRPQVVGVNDEYLRVGLAKTERVGHGGLERPPDVDEPMGVEDAVVGLVAQGAVDVVCVALGGQQPGVHGLDEAVDHPSTRRALGVARQPLLPDREERMTLLASEVLQLSVEHLALVLVIELCGRAVHRTDVEVVDGQAIGVQGAPQRRDGLLALPEFAAPVLPRALTLGLTQAVDDAFGCGAL
mmetsp:Transcript_28463/g.81997  ORF Transcript_28463/g.81997 Transcript_28463/m.81997 type:complete len:250 (+) Transcript_28463:1181-1930(+)